MEEGDGVRRTTYILICGGVELYSRLRTSSSKQKDPKEVILLRRNQRETAERRMNERSEREACIRNVSFP